MEPPRKFKKGDRVLDYEKDWWATVCYYQGNSEYVVVEYEAGKLTGCEVLLKEGLCLSESEGFIRRLKG